jgi:FdrA protein
MLSALKFLAEDGKTKVIVVAARTPTTSVAHRVLDAVRTTGKPAVVCFLGAGGGVKFPNGVAPAQTLEEAAAHAVSLAKKRGLGRATFTLSPDRIRKIAESEYSRFGYGQRYIRGLYSGGMLCTEAQVILRELVGTVRSNVPLELRLRLPDAHSSRGHACVDMGAPDLSGKNNPVTDLRPRCERLLKEAKDWEAAAVALDVILGHGAHPDPAGELARAVEEAKRTTDRGGGHLSVVASIVGTSKDPQNLSLQREKLEKAGVIVMPSNAQASRMAALIATAGDVWKKLKD